MSCGGIDRNSLIYCQGWFLKCFNPIVSETLEGAAWAFYHSQELQSFLRIWDCHPRSSEWAEDFVFAALRSGIDVLSCATCSLHAWGDSSACLPRVPQLKGEKSRENMEKHRRETGRYSSVLKMASSSTEPLLLPSEQRQFMPTFSLVFHKKWVIKFIINNKLC